MSNLTIHQRHPLQRNGSSRITRILQALAPDSFRIDNRSMQDLIVAAHRYARLLSYYDQNNKPDGDWACFWEVETLTYLAVLSAWDTDQLRKNYDDTDYQLAVALEKFNPSKGQTNPAPGFYRALLSHLFDMAKGLEEMYLKLVQINHPLQSLSLNIIRRDNQCDFEELQGALQRLVALHKGADDKLNHEQYAVFYADDNRWGIPNRKVYDLIKPDPKPKREKLRELFITFFNAYLILKSRAQVAFDAELAHMEKPESEAFRVVEPHVALFITFLRLFRYAQDSLNELTQKQLDYYYETVLCLHRKPAEPDSMYLIFTLAKNFETELIEKGTLLLGGSDKNGKQLFYETVQDWVVSQAQVEEVKNLFVARKYSFNYESNQQLSVNHKTILYNAFKPDGKKPARTFADDAESAEAEVGFVVASPQLWMQEGNRWIEIAIDDVDGPVYSNDNLNVYVSGKEGWQLVPPGNGSLFSLATLSDINSTPPVFGTPASNIQIPTVSGKGKGVLHIQLTLPPDFPALEAMPGGMSHWPAVKITLKKDALGLVGNDYNLLIEKNKSAVQISVRAEGVSKSLILQTDTGVFKGDQQLMPFGPTTPKGARFYVGNAEALLKKVDTIAFNVDWVGVTSGYTLSNYFSKTGIPNGSISVHFLDNNKFDTDITSSANTILNGTTLLQNRLVYNPGKARGGTDFDFDRYEPSVRRGFVSFTFFGDFGHNVYAEDLALAAIGAAKVPPVPDPANLPNPPYIPTFNSFKLDYISVGQQMEEGLDEFFYVHPFDGFERVNDFYKVDHLGPVNEVNLFPDYINIKPGIGPADGHLFIGLSQLKPGSNISLLIQTLDGSELDPEKDPPLIQWGYLAAGNTWRDIPVSKILLDNTRGLTRPGLIQIAVPADISSEGNTLLSPALLWLRAVALEGQDRSAAALPDLTDLRAQVVAARLLMEEGIEPEHLTDGLPAESVSKLTQSRSAVKSIAQPFASFDGRMAETAGMAFYVRVSERLRHRDRALTVWDYEHLLLERYDDLATVKCIPHTNYRVFPASELAPGFVAVAVIPDLKKRTGTSRTQPRFPKGDLDGMRDYLNTKANLFLNEPVLDAFGNRVGDHKYLQVVNAQYEPIRITVEVRFRQGIDEVFYKVQLSNDLKHYLSPWVADEQAMPVFGRTLRCSKIQQFIEELPYIDIIEFFEARKNNELLTEDILPGAAHGILTTARIHRINGVDVIQN